MVFLAKTAKCQLTRDPALVAGIDYDDLQPF